MALLIVGAFSLWFHSVFSSSFQSRKSGSSSGNPHNSNHYLSDGCVRDPKVTNILVLGEDSSSGDAYSRSDVILLISIDSRHDKIKLTSFMRDLCLDIPNFYPYKINSALSLGGPDLTIETIEKHFKIYIDRYAIISFSSFPEIIDKLGGIDIELKSYELDYLQWNPRSRVNESGLYHLNGEEALMYSRIRYAGNSDYERTERHRNVVTALINKLKGTRNPLTLAPLIKEVSNSIKTDLSADDSATLLSAFSKLSQYSKSEFRLPTNDNHRTENIPAYGGSILCINDMYQAQKDLLSFLYEELAE